MIRIITTGGTIEGLEYAEERNAPKVTRVSNETFLKTAQVSFDYEMEVAFSKDSRFITLEDRNLLADMIRKSKEEKVLITHGTLTMVETAKFLGALELNKTIVLVGAFVLGTDKNTDAPFNLGFAISSLGYLTKGVFIAMQGQIFPWDKVVKNTKENRFESL